MNWKRGHTLGHGSTATVSIATTSHGEVFAVKSSEVSKSEFLQREQKILSNLDSSYIVGYKGYDINMENNKPMFNLKMEYLPNGTISDAVRDSGGQLKEDLIRYYTRQIVQGLEYLHSCGLVHCDIKGRNILLGETGAKIADLGCAKWLTPVAGISDRGMKTVPIGGTPLFMAPEVARGEDQGFPADIWALGCTILEMATGGSPWPNPTNAASLLYRIAFSGELPEIPEYLSEKAKDFLSKCLRRDSKDRWTAKQLLKHPFLEEWNDISNQSQVIATSSPTSILDQGIWNSIEESETLSRTITENSSNTPAQRLGLLLSSNSSKPNWTWDETWITIRSSKDEERVAFGSLAGSSCHGMELESTTADESSRGFLGGSVSFKRNFSDVNMATTCIDQRFEISDLSFERHKKKQKLNQIHFP